jgi:hypothetical protein
MAAAAEVREACARLDLKGATAALGVVAKANPDWPPLAGLQSLVAALRTDTAEVETMVEELRAPRASVEDLRVAADKAGRWLVRRPEWSVRLAPAVGEAMRRIDADAAARKAEGERWALRARTARDAGDAEPLLAEYDSLSDAAREATRKERDRLVSLVAEAKRKAEADAAAAVAAEERRRAQEEARARAEEKRKADAKAAVETKLRQADEQRRKGDDTHRKTADRIAAFKRAVDLYEDVKGNESAEREARAQACFWCALLNKRLFDAYDGARPRSPIYYEAAKAHRASAIRHRDDLERLYPDVVDATGRETYAAALRRLFAE